MTMLRPECELNPANKPVLYGQSAYWAIYKAVAKRRSLIRGKLHDDKTGKHCAIGCFWDDKPDIALPTVIVDEIAAINDSLSARAMPKTRWRLVMRYLSRKLKTCYGIGS